MERICAWCNKKMGTIPSELETEKVITHGICIQCADKIYAEKGMELTSFLDRLEAPVVLVDDTGSVRTANKQARKLLQKDLTDIVGYQGGEVFRCANAGLPEGCGNTIHCSGCTIRNTVMDTLQSGKSHLNIPAYLNRGTPDNFKKIDFLISTEKAKGVVLLRIDKVSGNEQVRPK